MKKLISLLAVLCTLCILMSSCSFVPLMENPISKTTSTTESEESSAPEKDDVKAVAELYRRIEEATEGLESYKISEKAKISVTIDGIKMESDAVADITWLNDPLNGLHYRSSTETTIQTDEQTSVNMKEETCYATGKIYLSNTCHAYLNNSKIVAPMTEESFKQYLKDESFDIKAFFEECTESTWSKDENGCFFITAQKCSQKAIDDFCEKTGYDAETFETEIKDLKLSLSADQDFYIQTFSLQGVFEQNEGEATVMTVESTYTDHNKASFSFIPSMSQYAEIDSFDLIEDAEALFDALMASESGSFER